MDFLLLIHRGLELTVPVGRSIGVPLIPKSLAGMLSSLGKVEDLYLISNL